MNQIKYQDPKISLVSYMPPTAAYYAWLGSHLPSGARALARCSRFNVNGYPVDRVLFYDFCNEIFFEYHEYGERKTQLLRPDTVFTVDGQKVVNREYMQQVIREHNLQLNNFPTYIFEVTGSVLFRDFLFSINGSSRWATSRSLSKEQIKDCNNFPISAEYAGDIRYERQLYSYLRSLQLDPTSSAFPYSQSTTFWWGCNYKTLIDVLSLMKLEYPLLWRTYGKLFFGAFAQRHEHLSEDDLHPYVSDALQQYLKLDDWAEGMVKIKGIYIVDGKMELVNYSRSIRQSPAIISGLLPYLKEHPDEVLTGDTQIPYRLIADKNGIGDWFYKLINEIVDFQDEQQSH